MPDRNIADPIERIIADALGDAGIPFKHETEFMMDERKGLDFWLPDGGIFIEVKQFHSDRISAQMKKADNIIVIQGEKAAREFARWIRGNR